MIEQLLPPRRREIVVTQSRRVAVLQEREGARQLGLLDRGRRVGELSDETSDRRQFRREGVP